MVSIQIGRLLLRVSYSPCRQVNAAVPRLMSTSAALLGHPLYSALAEGQVSSALTPPREPSLVATRSVCGVLGNFKGYEPWSDDMANILQGSCMPGSTRYCRTSSMFGKVSLADITQSSVSYQRASFHTLRSFIPGTADPAPSYPSREFSLDKSKGSGGTGTWPLWSEDIACILQGTCMPGSTKYCRTPGMFGALTMSDVIQGTTVKYYSTEGSPEGGQVSLSQRQRLKLAVRDYGSTVIVFHVCIALTSLGGFYVAVSSGLDVQAFLKMLHFGEDIIASKLAAGASTFVLAYAVHKLFAPVRIAITLTCTPFIVRYLRSVGILKVKKVAVKTPP